jgi:PLP dependent protein
MDLAENLAEIRRHIRTACERAGRDPGTIELVAVSKGQPPAAVDAAVAAGQLLFGENKVQEARGKIPLCSGRATWHMIGHLQTNKCRDAVELFGMIHSVDSLRLAGELQRWSERLDRRVEVLLEVNLAGESSKFGYHPGMLRKDWTELQQLTALKFRGLMTMAPWTSDPEKARPVFRGLRELRERLQDEFQADLPHLSMGMSGDFEVAVEEGATLVRIGTALFGPRPPRTTPTAAPNTSLDT